MHQSYGYKVALRGYKIAKAQERKSQLRMAFDAMLIPLRREKLLKLVRGGIHELVYIRQFIKL